MNVILSPLCIIITLAYQSSNSEVFLMFCMSCLRRASSSSCAADPCCCCWDHHSQPTLAHPIVVHVSLFSPAWKRTQVSCMISLTEHVGARGLDQNVCSLISVACHV